MWQVVKAAEPSPSLSPPPKAPITSRQGCMLCTEHVVSPAPLLPAIIGWDQGTMFCALVSGERVILIRPQSHEQSSVGE